MRRPLFAMLLALACALPSPGLAGGGVHYTYLWHLEQPIYWPAPDASGLRYQRARESMEAKLGGAAHPQNDLDEIFGKDDRVAVYQGRVRDALATLQGHPEAGASVSYSGGLIENIQSLGGAGKLGYGAGWNTALREAQGWSTSQGTPRLDLVIFPFHHALLPLVDARVARRQIELYQQVYGEAWRDDKRSRGLFPSEMAFSERLIPSLAAAGIEWVIVSNSHLSRACADYPWVAGSGGDNIPPPNRADQTNPAQGSYNRISIDRGVSPANAYPFAYRPHRARYVDPATGQASKVIVVPAAQGESWKDGYSCYGMDEAQTYAPSSEPQHPILVVLAHDGDNAFGGGYSYYQECVPSLAGQAAAKGLTPTTIAGYLTDHPVAANDIVHVEDGAWVNADGDFGAPTFWNWSWPLMGGAEVDIANGWAEDQRNWAVITAATNVVLTAEDRLGPPPLGQILHPDQGGSLLAQAWHFLGGALNSGYMYYGKALDMELKPAVACNEAVARAEQAVGGAWEGETTGPTVWLPQRYPDNPGGTNFGPLYKYQVTELGPETWFWTFAHDVSGVESATLRWRRDKDGANATGTDDNEIYAGGPDVEAWQDVPMTRRVFPTGNVTNDPEIDDSILPTIIADEWYVQVTLPLDTLVDYYVEARDARGNTTRAPIQHVYVGASEGSGGAEGVWTPATPDCDDAVTIRHDRAGWLHWGVNGWQAPDAAWWPAGTADGGDGKAVESPLTPCDDHFCVTLGPFGDERPVQVIDFVFHHDDGSWDNHGGSDWHLPIGPCVEPPPDQGAPDVTGSDAAGTEVTESSDAASQIDASVDRVAQDMGAEGGAGPGADACEGGGCGEPASEEGSGGCAWSGSRREASAGALGLLLLGLAWLTATGRRRV